MIKRLTGQFNIIGKAALSSLAPALIRLALVVVGVVIGLVWAYALSPVQYRDAEPVYLADGYKDQWIKMTAAEYAATGDQAEAQRKLVSAGVTSEMILDLIEANQGSAPQLVNQLEPLVPLAEANESAARAQAEKIQTSLLGTLSPLLCIVGTIVIGLILAVFFTLYWAVPIGPWAKRRVTTTTVTGPLTGATIPGARPVVPPTNATGRIAASRAAAERKTDFAAVGEEPPVAQYMSTYILGDDLYDDSFSIETASGAFLGECGSGISETIGVGDPKKVTATEVWLFDKNDIRTVTKVLMSEHAFNDEALRTKLAPKGEAVLATEGGVTVLETQTLRVQVRIVDLQYGSGPLPRNSYFERLTVELAAWTKEEQAGNGRSQPPDTSAAFGDTAELLNY